MLLYHIISIISFNNEFIRWLAVRLDFIGVCLIFLVAILAVGIAYQGGTVDPNYLGMALVYALQLTGLLQWTVRVTIETETNMTAVERLLVFNAITPEKNNPVIDIGKLHEQIKYDAKARDPKDCTSNSTSSIDKNANNHTNNTCNSGAIVASSSGLKDLVWPHLGCIRLKNLQLRCEIMCLLFCQSVCTSDIT